MYNTVVIEQVQPTVVSILKETSIDVISKSVHPDLNKHSWHGASLLPSPVAVVHLLPFLMMLCKSRWIRVNKPNRYFWIDFPVRLLSGTSCFLPLGDTEAGEGCVANPEWGFFCHHDWKMYQTKEQGVWTNKGCWRCCSFVYHIFY